MACKIIYKDREFDTEEQLEQFITAELNGPTDVFLQAAEDSAEEQAEKFAERWGLVPISRFGVIGFAPKSGKVTRKLVNEIRERMKKVGGIYDKITPIYDATHGLINFRDENGQIMYQEEVSSTIPTQATPEQLRRVKEFLKRIGVNVELVKRITVDGIQYDANAMADLTNQLIQIVEGKEATALTEEAFHFAVEIIQQTNPRLFNQLMNRIGGYNIYNAVLSSPTYRQAYRNADGSIDIRAMKKEAIGKLLAETFAKQEFEVTEEPEKIQQANSWLDELIQWLKNLFSKAEFNPFEEAIKIIDTADSAVESTEGTLFQASSVSAQSMYEKILETHKKLSKNVDPEDGREKYFINGKPVKNRVTDLAKEWYSKTFKNQDITDNQYRDAINDQKKEKGTAGHKDLENLFHRYIDENGNRRDVELEMPESVLNPTNPEMITKLDKYMRELLDTYEPGTKFLAEVQLYDAANDRAGTIDFMAILPNGKMDIRDWKFMDIVATEKDVPWYKKTAFNIQLGEYKRMLNKVYGMGNFRYTRAIPILTQYKWDNWQTKTKLILKDITLGNIDPRKEKDLKLVPVGTSDESTGNKQVDTLIGQLNTLYTKLREEKVPGDQRLVRIEKLNSLERAIRSLQIQGKTDELVKSAANIIASLQKDMEGYIQQVQDNPNLTSEQKKEIADKILGDYGILTVFKDIESYFRRFDITDPERAELAATAKKASELLVDINQLRGEVGEIIANGYGFKNLLNRERVVKFLSRNFRSLSQAETVATRVLWKMQEKIKAQLAIEYDDEVKKLKKLKDRVDEVAKAKGVKTEDLLEKMKQKDSKGRWTGELIRKINGDFYTQLKRHQKEGDSKWIKENVDMKAYMEWYEKALETYTDWQSKQVYSLTDEEKNKEERTRRIREWMMEHSPKFDASFTNANEEWARFPLVTKWTSKEFKELQTEPALIEFYNYWQQRMKESYKSGMIQDVAYSRFVPNIKKSLLERMTHGAKGTAVDQKKDYFSSLKPDMNDEILRDPLTGQPINKLGARYIYDLGVRSVDKGGEEFDDYSRKSDDLFKVMAVWNNEIISFKLRQQVESEAKLIQSIEHTKGTVSINKRTKQEAISPDDKRNAEYYDNFMNAVLYNRKYIENADGTFKLPVNSYIKGINKVFKKTIGWEPLPESTEETIDISATKTVEALNRWFQMKTLGWNVISALSNLVGGTANAYIKAGTWFDKTDLWEGETRLASAKFNTEEGKIAAGLAQYFMPLTEDEMMEKARTLSVKGAVANMSSDWLFYLQRKSEKFVQLPVFWAFAKNTMVENGELVNIREYVRQQNNYDQIYQLSAGERQQLNEKIAKEIKDLVNTRSLFKTAQVVNDELVIPGIDRNSDTVYKFRNRVQQFSKDILGNMDPQDVYQYRMNLLFKSAMMFKNWIPRMADVRFGNLRYDVGKDDWEWGRARMLWSALFHNLYQGSKAFIGIASGKESLIDKAKSLYLQKQAEFGADEFMSEAAFVDMYVAGVTQSIRELLMWTALAGGLFGLGAAAPDGDEDDDTIKGAHKWAMRAMDKAQQELSFFYNPISMTAIANGNMWPALQTVVDLEKFAQNAITDGVYTIAGNEEGQNKTKTTKYLFRAIPILKEATTYVGIFSHEFAKEYGVVVSSQARGR